MTGTPQHSLHATVPRSAVWRVACKLNPCTQALRMRDERFLSNVFYFFSECFYLYEIKHYYVNWNRYASIQSPNSALPQIMAAKRSLELIVGRSHSL